MRGTDSWQMMHGWGISVMWFFWIPGIIIAVWFLLKLTDNGIRSKDKEDSPLEILKRRYANGEIGTDEYEKRKKVLETS